MSTDQQGPLELRYCPCEGGEAKCPNNIHGWPENWKATPAPENGSRGDVR